MSLKVRHVVETLAWGAAAYGALKIASLEGLLDGCSVCGPWG